MSTSLQRSETPRDRLIATARRLFTQHGVPHVGINRVIEEAGVARMTLYNNFASKDDLVAAAFEKEAELRRQSILAAQDQLEDPLEKVLALFAVALELANQKGFRGCAFLNLAIEAAAPDSALHGLTKAHKNWIFSNIIEYLPTETYPEPEKLARLILILWDGSIVGAYILQSNTPICTARDAARTLLQSAVK